MGIFDVFIAVVLGIVEGITEWLPISSTGHMILVNQFMAFSDSEFQEMFLVVVQLGAILAVVLLFWERIWPFNFKAKTNKEPFINMEIMQLWFKIIVSCLPAAIVGVLFDDIIDEMFYNAIVVAGALIIYGILFIVIENWNKGRRPVIVTVSEIGYNTAIIIGIFQLLAAIVPGTSRSGATILGALLIGVARGAAAEYTFYLAIPVMFGASLLRVAKFYLGGMTSTSQELGILAVGCVVAFVVSILAVRFLMAFVRRHDFKPFGWYRIALGVVVILYFTLA